MTSFDPPAPKGNGFSGFPTHALDAAVEATRHQSGTPARREHLQRAQIFATLALRDEVQLLTGTLAAFGRFAHEALRELRADGSAQVVSMRDRARERR